MAQEFDLSAEAARLDSTIRANRTFTLIAAIAFAAGAIYLLVRMFQALAALGGWGVAAEFDLVAAIIVFVIAGYWAYQYQVLRPSPRHLTVSDEELRFDGGAGPVLVVPLHGRPRFEVIDERPAHLARQARGRLPEFGGVDAIFDDGRQPVALSLEAMGSILEASRTAGLRIREVGTRELVAGPPHRYLVQEPG